MIKMSKSQLFTLAHKRARKMRGLGGRAYRQTFSECLKTGYSTWKAVDDMNRPSNYHRSFWEDRDPNAYKVRVLGEFPLTDMSMGMEMFEQAKEVS